MSFPNLFRRSVGLKRSLKLETINTSDVEAAKTVLAAARNVQKHFGVKTDTAKLAAALAVAHTRDEFAITLEAVGMNVIDTDEALRYRQERVKPTILERFKCWNRVVYRFLEKELLHGNFGKVSAWIALFFSVPFTFCWAIDTLWYGVHFLKSWPLIVLPQVVILAIISLSIGVNLGGEAEDEFDRKAGRIYARFNALVIGFPLQLLANILGIWFYPGPEKRKWTVKPLKQYDQPLSNGVVLTIDQILQVTPKARIELEVLEPVVGNYQELFVTLPLGGTGERIYLWHEAA